RPTRGSVRAAHSAREAPRAIDVALAIRRARSVGQATISPSFAAHFVDLGSARPRGARARLLAPDRTRWADRFDAPGAHHRHERVDGSGRTRRKDSDG